MRAVLTAAVMSLAGPALASDFSLAFPVDCELGTSCHIQQFVDRDPGSGSRDFTCGSLSYDGHKGTDFAVATIAQMNAGVDVLAAASGTVMGMRDGMLDILFTDAGASLVEGRECGNGVVIDHGDGWVTQYCHMKNGSVAVKTGDRVETGDRLGEIGLSGRTEFPHLHLSVRKDGNPIDPFDTGDVGTCAAGEGSLWETPLAYVPGGLLDIGFSDGVPEYTDVRAGTADKALSRDAPAIVLFAYAFGSQAGDVLQLETNGPDGEVFSHTVELERTQAQFFRASGIRVRSQLTPGTYVGTVAYQRDGQTIDSAEISLQID